MNTVAQFATGVESAYGTAVTVDRFYPVLDGEGLKRGQSVLQPAGLRPNLWCPLGTGRTVGRHWGEGPVTMEVGPSGFGRWFHHMLGAGTVAQHGTVAAYNHTYTPGSLTARSLTIQKAVMNTAGSAVPFTFEGCKIPEWELKIGNDGYCLLSVTVDAEQVRDTTALAAANYGTLIPFNFTEAALTLGGTALAGVTDFSVKGNNNLKLDRWYLGTGGVKANPIEQGYRTLSGQLVAEFADGDVLYDAYEADTSLGLVLTFTGPNIVAATPALLVVTLADIRLGGDMPEMAEGPSTVTCPFEGFEAAAGGTAIKIEYRSPDSAI